MAKANTTWKVHPHGAIEKLGDHLWRELADLPGLSRVVVSHHNTITEDPSGTLKNVVAAL